MVYNIYDALVSLSTDTPRLYNAIVQYYHIIVYATGKHCIFAINQYKGKFHFMIDFKSRLCLSRQVPLVPLAVQFYVFFILLLSNNRILHCFTILSHCIFTINEHKGKRHYIDDLKTLFVYHVEYRWFNRVLHFIAL